MACCVRGYHEYKDIEAAATREVLVCGRWRAVVGKFFIVKLSCVRVRYFCTFSVYENIFAMKKSELQYSCVHAVHIFECGNAIEVWNGIMFDFYLRLSDLYYSWCAIKSMILSGAGNVASFPGSPGTRIYIARRAWYLSHVSMT